MGYLFASVGPPRGLSKRWIFWSLKKSENNALIDNDDDDNYDNTDLLCQEDDEEDYDLLVRS